MTKPRIIIADPDYAFLLALQLKFAEQFINNVDVEIIDNYVYFTELFSTPQNINVLILSEKWYSKEMLRHSIDSILVLSESVIGEESDQRVFEINRTDSISSIYDQIIKLNTCLSIVTDNNGNRKKPKLVVVYSASGGTGVTTLSLALSVCLSQKQKRVLYLEAARINSFQCHVKNAGYLSSPVAISKLSMDRISYDDVKEIIKNEGFSYLPPFRTATLSYGIKYNLFRKLAISARDSGDFDYVIVDADSVLDEDKIELLELSDTTMIVVEPSAVSVTSTKVLTGCISGMLADEKYLFVGSKIMSDLKSYEELTEFGISTGVQFFKDYSNCSIEDIASDEAVRTVANLIS